MFDTAFPDAMDNALRYDVPRQRQSLGWFKGTAGAVAAAPAAATFDVLSALSPVLDAFGKTVAFTEGQSKSTSIDRIGDNEMGPQMRAEARKLTPDPAETGKAAEILHGVARVMTKAVPLAMAGGLPAAAVGTGAVEGTVEAQNLGDEGVNSTTAAQVGAVKGVLTAAQIALPMSAASKVGTAALVAVGGPGSFMAEQAASRFILDHADYHDIARRYNPLDPVGLSVATLMAGTFGAFGHAAGARAAGKAGEVAPAADIVPELAPGAEITPDMIAAARMHQMGEHVQDTGLYKPGDLAGSMAHVNALDAAARAIDAGERVEVGDIVRPEGVSEPRTAEAARQYAEGVARAEVVAKTRAELLGVAAGRAEPGIVRQIEADRPNLQRQLDTLDDSLKDRAKAFQEQGLSRKQAEAAARKEVDIVRADLQAKLQRLDQQVEANRTAAQAEQDLASLDSGDLPATVQALVDQRIGEIQKGLQPTPLASAIGDLFPPEQVKSAFAAEKVEPSPENMAAVQLIARARQNDAAAVDSLPHDMPDAEYLARVKEIANAEQNDAGTGPGGPKARQQGSETAAGQDGQSAGAAGREAPAGQSDGAAAGEVGREAPDAVETAAQQAAKAEPEAMVPDPETGALVPAAKLLADAEATFQQRQVEAKAYEAAITCFLRH